jgi:hypothetical protein
VLEIDDRRHLIIEQAVHRAAARDAVDELAGGTTLNRTACAHLDQLELTPINPRWRAMAAAAAHTLARGAWRS